MISLSHSTLSSSAENEELIRLSSRMQNYATILGEGGVPFREDTAIPSENE